MILNEKFYTRTINGLALCDGKRINEDYAVIRPWFKKNSYNPYVIRRYYVIHIKSGLAVTKDYYSAKDAVNNLEKDLEAVKKKIKELGKEALYIPDFDEVIKYIKENVKENDLVLTLGAGTITDISFKLVK